MNVADAPTDSPIGGPGRTNSPCVRIWYFPPVYFFDAVHPRRALRAFGSQQGRTAPRARWDFPDWPANPPFPVIQVTFPSLEFCFCKISLIQSPRVNIWRARLAGIIVPPSGLGVPGRVMFRRRSRNCRIPHHERSSHAMQFRCGLCFS